MYNEIIEPVLRSMNTKDERVINETLSQALTDEGYPDILCLGVYHQHNDTFEGAILDGMNMNNGPIERFIYHYQIETFEVI